MRKDVAGRRRCRAVRQIPRAATSAISAARPGAMRGATQIARPALIASAYTVSFVFEMRCVAWRLENPRRRRSCRRDVGRVGPHRSVVERRRSRCEMLASDANSAAASSNTRPPNINCCNTRPAAIDGEGAIPFASKTGLERPRHPWRRVACHLRYKFTRVVASDCGTRLIHCGGQTAR